MDGLVIITGGGTAGHVFPMQAVADALIAQGLAPAELRFVGSRRGQEGSLLRAHGVALTLLPGRGLSRSWRRRDVFLNIGSALRLIGATVAALFLLRRWRPSVVVSVGGYASAAICVAALCWRRPLVLVDFDATPGAVHRILGRFATKRCCTFESAAANAVVTGAPLRHEIENVTRSKVDRDQAKRSFNPPIDSARLVIVVMTGSIGSARVNEAVSDLATRWRSRRDRAIIHVTGRRDYEQFLSRAPQECDLDYRVVAFGDMVELWTVADAAVCRAGANTIAELTLLAIPSLLVPLPRAPGGHQTKNAEVVVRAGGAHLLRDEDCTGAALEAHLEVMLTPERLNALECGAGSLGHRGGARAIAQVIVELRGDR